LPLRWVARIGRAGGALAYVVDARHRRVAMRNLTQCFAAEKSPLEIKTLARENFKRLGENYCCAIKTAGMTWTELKPHLEFGGLEKLSAQPVGNGSEEGPANYVMAIGHFGNFELYARANNLFPTLRFATTYRALNQPSLNRLLTELRTRSGCLIFERRQESEGLRFAMSQGHLMLGFLSDQHAGPGGVWIPFFNHPCSTTTAPAVFAIRYKAPLHTAICYRIGLARWRFEVGDVIPTQQAGQRRSSEDIMLEVNRAFETAIRRDPANWFWVHKRWKPRQLKASKVNSAPRLPDPGLPVAEPAGRADPGPVKSPNSRS
jgi:lauroyl/myristoyl acyltransferase